VMAAGGFFHVDYWLSQRMGMEFLL
jgi:hypothetical protein